MDIEEIAMGLIGNAGEGKSNAFEALREAKKGNFEKADELMKSAQEKILQAHKLQTELICREAGGEKLELGLIMVHAQDHLMGAISSRELIGEMIELYKRIG